jgi:hypothetical protein
MFKFKKIASILATTAMLGSTLAFATAATYPAPFISSGTADGAIVVGANAASTDWAVAIDLGQSLSSLVTTSSSSSTATATGGDSVELWRSSDKFNIRDSLTTVKSTTITDQDLPTLLADGTYTDDNNEEFDYTQTVTLTNMYLTHFSDSDYKDKVPTIGINITNGAPIINYTLEFTKNPDFNATKLETTTLTLMGKEYYVLNFVNTSAGKLTLLDSANSALITEGEETTVTVGDKEYTVSLSYVGSTTAKITVNGETSNSLSASGTYKLSDGSYIGVKEILYNAKDTGISKVELSIGSGKLELEDGTQIELNDVSIEEITAHLVTSGSTFDKIILEWKTDDRSFITSDTDLEMPGFKSLKLTMGEITPKTEEVTEIALSGDDKIELRTSLKDDSEVTIPLLYADSTSGGNFTGIGESSTKKLVTRSGVDLNFNKSAEDEWFVASWNTTSEGESYLFRTKNWRSSNGVNYTTLYTTGGSENEVSTGTTASFGNIEFTIDQVLKGGSNDFVNLTINSGGSFNTLYTAEGLKIYLPYQGANNSAAKGIINITCENSTDCTDGHARDKWYLFMDEEDKDSNLARGSSFNFTIQSRLSSNDYELEVNSVSTGKTGFEIGDTEDYEYYVPSDLATKIVHDTDGNPDSATVTYHGDQLFAEVFLAAPSVTVTPGSSGGEGGQITVVKDNEVDSVSTKNLVVVGGSCINTVAATLLGSSAPLCGADFTEKTTVGAGQYIIKVFSSPVAAADSGKVAMLVAGYNAADTEQAVAKVKEGGMMTDVGTEVIGPTTA